MAVSRRLRFEILRRDGFTCRYCGASAPDVLLEVDHVIPEALGGSSEPTNLATSCEACNGGKSATPPHASLVEDVAADAVRWRQAIEQASVEIQANREVVDDLCERFQRVWLGPIVEEPESLDIPWAEVAGSAAGHSRPLRIEHQYLLVEVDHPAWATRLRCDAGDITRRLNLGADLRLKGLTVSTGTQVQPPADMPESWRPSVERFLSNGLTIDRLCQLAESTKTLSGLRDPWRWFCKVAWNEISALQESARRLLESGTVE